MLLLLCLIFTLTLIFGCGEQQKADEDTTEQAVEEVTEEAAVDTTVAVEEDTTAAPETEAAPE